jgi:hypothetical protein
MTHRRGGPRRTAPLSLSLLLMAAAVGCSGSDEGAPGSANDTTTPGQTVPGPETTTPGATETTEPGVPEEAGVPGVPEGPAPPDEPTMPDDAAVPTPTPTMPIGDVRDPRPTFLDNVVTDPASTTVVVWFWMGVPPCSVLDRVEVEETPVLVKITVYTGTSADAPPDIACIQLAELYSTTVSLDAPLGRRDIVDGSAG